jgi:hypothetical protein
VSRSEAVASGTEGQRDGGRAASAALNDLLPRHGRIGDVHPILPLADGVPLGAGAGGAAGTGAGSGAQSGTV